MSKAYLADRVPIIVLALVCLGLNPARALNSWTANPIADAFVTNGPTNNLSGNNYGAAGSLAISGSGSSKGTFDSVLRFDLAGAKANFDAVFGAGLWTAQSITLQLTAASPNNAIFNANVAGSFTVVWMQNDSWVEGSGAPMAPTTTGITYTSLPGFLGAGDQSLGTFSYDGGNSSVATYTLGAGSGLLADLAAGNLASFELLAADSNVSFLSNSRSFNTVASRPLLSVTAVAVPESSDYFVLGIGAMLLAVARRLKIVRARA